MQNASLELRCIHAKFTHLAEFLEDKEYGGCEEELREGEELEGREAVKPQAWGGEHQFVDEHNGLKINEQASADLSGRMNMTMLSSKNLPHFRHLGSV